MATPTVRRMRIDEAAAVADLVLRANEEHLCCFPAEVASGYRAEIVGVAARLPSAEVYVALAGPRLVGSVTYMADAADDGHPWPPGGSVLRFLAVDPGARGCGLGTRLTGTCIERARGQGARFLGLHTAPLMEAAQRVYRRLGFERAPEYDFNPMAHYGGGATGGPACPPPHAQGLAYVLPLARRGTS